MIFLMIALALAVGATGFLGWRLYITRQALAQAKAQCEDMKQDRAIRENLQSILDRREIQLRKMRRKAEQCEAKAREYEDKAAELNLSLFHESGLRILAEKEDSARRMKLELAERQLEDAQRRLKEERAEAEAAQRILQETIQELQRQVKRLAAQQSRRARHAAASLPEQMTFEDLIGVKQEA